MQTLACRHGDGRMLGHRVLPWWSWRSSSITMTTSRLRAAASGASTAARYETSRRRWVHGWRSDTGSLPPANGWSRSQTKKIALNLIEFYIILHAGGTLCRRKSTCFYTRRENSLTYSHIPHFRDHFNYGPSLWSDLNRWMNEWLIIRRTKLLKIFIYHTVIGPSSRKSA